MTLLAVGPASALQRSVSADHPMEALKNLCAVAKTGNAAAQYQLAQHYCCAPHTDWRRAVHWYSQAAVQKYAPACVALGDLFAQGVAGVLPQNHRSAVVLYTQAAKQNNTSAYLRLARFFNEQNAPEKVVFYYNLAIQGNCEVARLELGIFYLLRDEHDDAIQYLRPLAILEPIQPNAVFSWIRVQATYFLAIVYEEHSNSQIRDRNHARTLYEKAAQFKLGEAQYRLGNLLLKHFPDQANVAVQLLQAAANQHYSPAEYLIGVLHEMGKHGLPRNVKTAVGYYARAAEKGHSPAMCRLGVLYQYGIEVVVDLEKAKEWYQKAAQNGIVEASRRLAFMANEDPAAAFYLGLFHLDRGNFFYNPYVGVDWLKLAVYHKHSEACLWLARLYTEGEGCNADPFKADHYFQMALNRAPAQEDHERIRLQFKAIQGNAADQLAYGHFLLKKGELDDGIEWIAKAAQQGNLMATQELASIYDHLGEFDLAVDFYTRCIALGDLSAFAEIGSLYEDQEDYDQAIEWFAKSAAAGDAKGETRRLINIELKLAKAGDLQALFRAAALCIKIDEYPSALRCYLKAADQNLPEACFKAAELLEQGALDLQRNLSAAIQLYKKAADMQHAASIHRLGELAQSGMDECNDELELPEVYYMQAAALGHLPSILKMIQICKETRNPRLVRYLQQATQLGDAQAPYELAQFFFNQRRLLDAHHFLKIAAERGHARAIFMMGVVCQKHQQLEEAAQWYQKAAHLGIVGAFCKLGELAEERRDFSQALIQYHQAAKRGVPEAFFHLGNFYLSHRNDAPPNFGLAKRFFEEALKRGVVRARESLAHLAFFA